jgi:hypothetical protein
MDLETNIVNSPYYPAKPERCKKVNLPRKHERTPVKRKKGLTGQAKTRKKRNI